MFPKKQAAKARLTARFVLGLAAADQSLKKLFRTPDVGWTHIDITESKMAKDPFSSERWRVYLKGKFFARNTPHFYDGTIQVSLRKMSGGEWETEFIFIECIEPESGFPLDSDGYLIKSNTAYISKREADRWDKHSFDDVLPTLTSRYEIPGQE